MELEHKAFWASKELNMDLDAASRKRKFQLNELHEWRERAYESMRIYKEKSKRLHDSKIRHPKQFHEGDQVLLFNSQLKLFPGKLKSRWSGPFLVKQIFPHGAVEVQHPDEHSLKVNGQQLKLYLGIREENEGQEEFRLHPIIT